MAAHPARDDGAPAPQRIRLDKWLWAARFFKTRQLATEAINGGKVHLNGQRTKPGKEIGLGDRLQITKGPFTWDITVAAISPQRRPAKEAALLYEETPESLTRRKAEIEKQREEQGQRLYPAQRPSKKDRRLIHRFKRELPGSH